MRRKRWLDAEVESKEALNVIAMKRGKSKQVFKINWDRSGSGNGTQMTLLFAFFELKFA